MLRLTEHLPAAAIHHVPEILYHWRMSGNSTAASGTAKPDAAKAGVLAVSEHLARRKIKAKVKRRGDLTCYRVAFPATADASVSILIPFRDHIQMTRNCVNAIRTQTRGVDYQNSSVG